MSVTPGYIESEIIQLQKLTAVRNDLDNLQIYFYVYLGISIGVILLALALIARLFILYERLRYNNGQKSNEPEIKISRPQLNTENNFRRFTLPEEEHQRQSYQQPNRMNGRNPMSNTGYNAPTYLDEIRNYNHHNVGGKKNEHQYSSPGSEYFTKIHERSKFTY